MSAIKKKIQMVGCGACGKTYLTKVFCNDIYPCDFAPIVYGTLCSEIVVDNQKVELEISIVSGQEDYDRLRPLFYPGTDVVLMCFGINSLCSLDMIMKKWYPLMKYYCGNAPIVVVGNKKDLRDNSNKSYELVKYEYGLLTAQKINAVNYLECSAKTKDGVREVFETATRAALSVMQKK